MFGCFRRVIGLVVLAVVGVGAYATRDIWLPKLRAAMGERPPAGGTEAPAAAAAPAEAAADSAWVGLSAVAAERGRKAVARLGQGRGPAFVAISAGEFASAVLDSLAAQLPASAESLRVRAQGNELQVRASVRLGDLGGRAVLGPLAAMVGDRERLTLGGTMEPGATPGHAQFRLTRVKVGDFAVPSAMVPRLVQALKLRGTGSGADASALPVKLPKGVGDVRVAQGKVTLYRATP